MKILTKKKQREIVDRLDWARKAFNRVYDSADGEAVEAASELFSDELIEVVLMIAGVKGLDQMIANLEKELANDSN